MSYDVGAIVELRINYEVNDQSCYNILHYFAEGSGAGIDIPDLQLAFCTYMAEEVDGRLVKEMRDMMSSDAVVVQLFAQQVYPTRYRSSRLLVGDLGLVLTPSTAQNVAAVVEKHGMLAARSAVGSFHLGGLPSSFYSAGELVEDAQTQLTVIANLLKNAVTVPGEQGATYTPCILNKTPIPNTNPVRYQISGGTEITGAIPMTTLRTMRRRTKGVGT